MMRKELFLILLLSSCMQQKQKDNGTFAQDLDFLRARDSVIVLSSGEAKLIVSPKYQGKVFTSTSDGQQSFGWIHYSAFDGPPDPHMNAYGGENRLWLGPEGGPFSLFFPKGAAMEFAHWKTPAAFDSEAWELLSADSKSVALKKDMQLVNYAGTRLQLSVARNISILGRSSIDSLLRIKVQAGVHAVGYTTENLLTNTGTNAWDATTGAPCLWMLDMLKPSAQTTIVIPHLPDANPATTNYFGEIPDDRIKYQPGLLYFKADGKQRGKLGIHPAAAKNIAGSYDAENQVLTITLFDVDPSASYLNQEWTTTKAPYSGDAVNAYNDGPLADGKQMGPFYEIESVSPAAFLKPNEQLVHHHAVFHFTGAETSLDNIAQQVLGVSLQQIKTIFR